MEFGCKTETDSDASSHRSVLNPLLMVVLQDASEISCQLCTINLLVKLVHVVQQQDLHSTPSSSNIRSLRIEAVYRGARWCGHLEGPTLWHVRFVQSSIISLLLILFAPAIKTRHRASTSMHSLTFCVRVLLPERHQWKPAVPAAAVMLRTPPVDGQSPARIEPLDLLLAPHANHRPSTYAKQKYKELVIEVVCSQVACNRKHTQPTLVLKSSLRNFSPTSAKAFCRKLDGRSTNTLCRSAGKNPYNTIDDVYCC